jgi:hypothetical protein
VKVTSIGCGRTYNTGNYTSQRFDMTVDLEDGEEADLVMLDLAARLHGVALEVMRQAGVRKLVEPSGPITLKAAKAANAAEEEDDEIPF